MISSVAFRSSFLLSRRCLSTNASTTGVFRKIGFIGVGTMAQAMIDPMIQTGLQPAEQITVFDVSTAALQSVSKAYPGLVVAQNLQDVVDDADLVVCAVKPQNLGPDFFASMKPPPKATLLSVIAGKPMSVYLEGGFSKVARSMPNTPAQIGKGMTVWCCTQNIETEERGKITQILSSFGKQIYVDDEDFIDISTSISGSGPAYVFMLMEAMIDAGVHMGFSRKTATTLVNQTILGSTLYAMETGEHPVILRNSVTSPAGTTASAIYELENGKFRTVIKDAIWACYRRSLEMGDKDSNVGPGRVHRQEIVIVPRGEAHVDAILYGKGPADKK
jgi:pyrroline-5-carboxylate reductase